MVSPQDSPAVLSTLCFLRLAQGRIAEALTTAEDAFARYNAMRTCSLFRVGSRPRGQANSQGTLPGQANSQGTLPGSAGSLCASTSSPSR